MIQLDIPKEFRGIKDMLHQVALTTFRPYAREADRKHSPPKEFLDKAKGMAAMMGGAMGGGASQAKKERDASKDKKAGTRNRMGIIGSEELAWGDAALLLQIPGPGLGGPPIQITGTEDQKKRFLGIFAGGDIKYGAYALTEPGAGTDVSAISTTAKKDGDYYILNGTKCFITNGAKAEWNVVFATVDKSKGRSGHRAFAVWNKNPGFRVGKIEEKLGLRASETAELIYEDCRVHKDDLLGGEEHYEKLASGGFKTAMATFDSTRPMVAAMAVGIARASYEYARDWLKERYDFKRPIPRYQAMFNDLAEMERKLDAARLLCWNAAYMADMGIPNAKEASMSKAYAGQWCTWICYKAVELMGPDGLNEEHLVEKWFRDIKVYDIFEGTAQAQRIVISKRIISGIQSF